VSDKDGKQPATVKCKTDRGFYDWMAGQNISLAITTYQAGKLLFVGWNGKNVSLHARNFDKAMGLDVQGSQLALATTDRILRFSNDRLLTADCVPEQPNRYDALYLLRASHFTGPVFAHDLAFAGNELWFVNTRFCCLATLDYQHNFVPQWHPHFISELAPEDRCHLNGLALKNDMPRTVTALGATNTPRGWKDDKISGGVVMDVPSNEIILRGLAMPHSPRWYRDKLYVLDSGRGHLLHVNSSQQNADIVCALPAYLRGLAFHGDFAIVGLCKIREKRVFGGLPIEERVKDLMCGIAVVNIVTGEHVGTFEFTEGVEEIYDIRTLPYLRPNLFNTQQGELYRAITAPEFSYWLPVPPVQVNKPEQDVAGG
jgi:uncharacterized protein (TIGR03032 family)